MRGKCQFLFHLTLIISFIIGTTTLLSPAAALMTTLLVKPSKTVNTNLTPNSTFNIYIHVQYAFDLYGFQFSLKFSPNVLNATNVSLVISGGLFPTGSTEWHKEINNDEGYVSYAVSMPAGTDKGVSASGRLAAISFKVKDYGESLLHLYNTILGSSPENPDYHGGPMPHDVQDGYFANLILTHDIAVTNVTASPTSVPVGDSVSINVIVENQGDATETFINVFVYYNVTTNIGNVTTNIGNVTITSLSPGAQNTTTFTWDTIDVTQVPGNFTIWAEALSSWPEYLNIETDRADNTLNDGQVTLYPRNIAITNVTASPTAVNKTEPVSINVTVKNEGYFAETFNVTTYYNNTFIDTQTVVALASQVNTTLTFTWDTTYVSPKNYAISARASIIRGEWNTTDNIYEDGTITVTLPPGFPTASFVVSPYPPYVVGETLEFNSTSKDPDGYIVSWNWNFGDGTSGTGETVTHTYTAVGTYTVTLTVTDNASLTDSIQKSINIEKQSSAISITASLTYIVAGESTTISGSITPNRAGVTVTISYRLSGQTTWSILTTVTTNDTSQYSYNWMTKNAGIYEVKAKWEGDANTEPAEAPIPVGIMVTKMASTISITANPATVTLESSVTLSGAISPVRASVTVTIQYKPSGGTWTTLKTVTTDSDGKYSYTWTPTTVKTFQIKAKWEGDANTEPAESPITTVTVPKMPSTISINVNETSITLGSSVTLSGAISPVRASVTVTIQYKPSGGTWTTLTTRTTDSNGQYSYTWTPSAFETFQVKASWLGDANTLEAESDAKTLAVKAPPVASFTYAPSASKVGDPVTFKSNSTDPDGYIVSWNWNFGDGTSGTGETVTHTYATAGDFTVKLTITDNDGLTNTKSITITVSEAPTGISIYLIAAIGAIIIMAIGIAAYSLIRKKP